MMESLLDAVGFFLLIGLLLLAPLLLGGYLLYHLLTQALLPEERRFEHMKFSDLLHPRGPKHPGREKLTPIPPKERIEYAPKTAKGETARTERPRRYGT